MGTAYNLAQHMVIYFHDKIFVLIQHRVKKKCLVVWSCIAILFRNVSI